MVNENNETIEPAGLDNQSIARAENNIYEYRDVPSPQSTKTRISQTTTNPDPTRTSSMGSILTGSALSLRDNQKSPSPTNNIQLTNRTRSKTQLVQGVPQTQV